MIIRLVVGTLVAVGVTDTGPTPDVLFTMTSIEPAG